MHFRTVVHTFVYQIRENIETVLSTLLKGTRRVPEFEVSIMDDVVQRRRRPKTARVAKPKTRTELHKELDQFSGIEQEDNSRVLDSLLLESPTHSHRAVGLPKRKARRLLQTQSLSSIPEAAEPQRMPCSRVAQVLAAFQRADTDNSGDLSLQEWKEEFGDNVDVNVLRKVFDKTDRNRDGKVSVEEFKQAFAREGLLPDENKIERLRTRLAAAIRRRASVHFASADSNMSGDLSRSEFTQAFGADFDREELQMLFDFLDSSGDGRISLAEFRAGTVSSALHIDDDAVLSDLTSDTKAYVSMNSFSLRMEPAVKQHKKRDSLLHSTSVSDTIKRINQRTDALVKTLFDSTVRLFLSCFRLLFFRSIPRHACRAQTSFRLFFFGPRHQASNPVRIATMHVYPRIRIGSEEAARKRARHK